MGNDSKMVSWRCRDCLSFGSSVDGDAAAKDAANHALEFKHKVDRGGFRVTDGSPVPAERAYGRKDGSPFATVEEAEQFAANLRTMPGFSACTIKIAEVSGDCESWPTRIKRPALREGEE